MTISTRLLLIRGAPGSGKSTMAKQFLDDGHFDVHYEADMYFMQDGEYKYDHTKISQAHHWCQAKVLEALLENKRVIVSNTFTKNWELEGYLQQLHLATPVDEDGHRPFKVSIMKAYGEYDNSHGVPANKVAQMRADYEDFTTDVMNVMLDKFDKELRNVH